MLESTLNLENYYSQSRDTELFSLVRNKHDMNGGKKSRGNIPVFPPLIQTLKITRISIDKVYLALIKT